MHPLPPASMPEQYRGDMAYCVENEVALPDSDPVGNRIRIENGEVVFRHGVVELNWSSNESYKLIQV